VCGTPDGPACPVDQVWSIAAGACAPSCALSEILVNGKCCSQKDMLPGGACSNGDPSSSKGDPSTGIAKPMCGVTQTAIGPKNECCDNDRIYSGPSGGQLCCATALVNGVCEPLKTKIPICPGCCAPGYVKIGGKCCLKSQATSKGQCCPVGETPSADGTQCLHLPSFKIPKFSLCCASGFVPTGSGKC
jgi:hypothetical protein